MAGPRGTVPGGSGLCHEGAATPLGPREMCSVGPRRQEGCRQTPGFAFCLPSLRCPWPPLAKFSLRPEGNGLHGGLWSQGWGEALERTHTERAH